MPEIQGVRGLRRPGGNDAGTQKVGLPPSRRFHRFNQGASATVCPAYASGWNRWRFPLGWLIIFSFPFLLSPGIFNIQARSNRTRPTHQDGWPGKTILEYQRCGFWALLRRVFCDQHQIRKFAHVRRSLRKTARSWANIASLPIQILDPQRFDCKTEHVL